MSTQHCLVCSSVVSVTAQFCHVCGAPLAQRQPGVDHGLLPIGTRVAGGNYTIGKLLGRGGFGITYLGSDARLTRLVALKEFFPAGAVRQGTIVVPPGTLAEKDYTAATQRFLQEAQVLARFRHPGIVAVHDVFQANRTAYMVMEYLHGSTLAQIIEQRAAPLAEAEIVALARPLADALDQIHAAGMLHRDIKPENIVVSNGATPIRPVLIDFGAAREFVRGATIRQSVVLTPGYAPLEQYGERARRGPYTDLYAFAATLYHLATGVAPAAAIDRAVGVELDEPRKLNPRLSPAFNRALMRALEIDAAQRTQSAGDLIRELTASKPVSGGSRPTVRRDSSARATDRASAQPSTDPPRAATRPAYLDRLQRIARELGVEQRPDDRLICPACHKAALVDPARLSGPIGCAVCRKAVLTERIAPDASRRCPVCRRGKLAAVAASGLMRCPACRIGTVTRYTRRRKFLVIQVQGARCDRCAADFDFDPISDTLTLTDLPSGRGFLPADVLRQGLPRQKWIALSTRRTEGMLRCDAPDCAAEFDREADVFRLKIVGAQPDRMPPQHYDQAHTALAWAKIAHGVRPTDGTHACPGCAAQFDADGDRITLIRAPRDPFGVFRLYHHQAKEPRFWRALVMGARDPSASTLICPACSAELRPGRGDDLRLVSGQRDHPPIAAAALRGAHSSAASLARIPAARAQTLRSAAQRELRQALIAGQYRDPLAEHSYRGTRSRGEQIVVSIKATHVRNTSGSFYDYDHGPLWITSARLFFHGARANVTVPLDKIIACRCERRPGVADLLVLRRADRARPQYFAIDDLLSLTVEGMAIELRFTAELVAELIDRLRTAARADGRTVGG